MQDFFRFVPGQEVAARKCAYRACFKKVKDFIYHARVQAVVDYHTNIFKVRMSKPEAIKVHLTKDQYMRVNIDQY